tara:strand:- start:3711 stop:4874 length:1164 start_codon:yes stop_codon:yes gene_type:complete
MAVNVNTVYQRVLTLANKEQRGYITPQEFNILANQAQMDLFEQYFYDINQFNKIPGNYREFSDMLHILEEKIAPFKVNEAALTASSVLFEDNFEADITDWSEVTAGNGIISHDLPSSANGFNGGLKILQDSNSATHTAESGVTFALTIGKQYMVSWEITDFGVGSSSSAVAPSYYSILIDKANVVSVNHNVLDPTIGSFNFIFEADVSANYNIRLQNGDTGNATRYITFGSISVKEIDNSTLPTDLYRLGSVLLKTAGSSYATGVDEVSAKEATMFNLSPLARPTEENPVYVRSSSNSITVHPSVSSTSTLRCNYIKTPTDVNWVGQTVNNAAIYNSTNSTDFELHESEEVNLVNRILVLAGIMIEDPTLGTAMGSEELKDIQQEKQ